MLKTNLEYFTQNFLVKINKKGDSKMAFGIQEITLSIIIGTLAAIVYSLRVLVLMERRIARIEMHIERVVDRLMKEELRIERAIKKKR